MTYSQLLYEEATISLELEGMDNSALIDEVSVILINFENPAIDDIMNSFFKEGNLIKEQRKALEQFYCLAYREFVWSE